MNHWSSYKSRSNPDVHRPKRETWGEGEEESSTTHGGGIKERGERAPLDRRVTTEVDGTESD